MAEDGGKGGLPPKRAQLLSKPAEVPGGETARANGEATGVPRPLRADNQRPNRPAGNAVDVRTMIVGKETSFSGKIASCRRLIVEGKVEASLENCQHVIVNETGAFKGDGATENADIYGAFEGRLDVRNRLLVRSTGRISGTITYGEIEIERGGRIGGTIQANDGTVSFQPGRAPAAKGVGMDRGRRKSARPREDSHTERADKNAGPKDPAPDG